jgi:hypothetical protein
MFANILPPNRPELNLTPFTSPVAVHRELIHSVSVSKSPIDPHKTSGVLYGEIGALLRLPMETQGASVSLSGGEIGAVLPATYRETRLRSALTRPNVVGDK